MGAGCCRAQTEDTKSGQKPLKPGKREAQVGRRGLRQKENYDHIKQIFDL